jgi:selenide,water dikinase
MGGRPITSLALVCFPDKVAIEILEQIMAGGLSKMVEAGCTVIGGHSIRDEETKFGYAVTGVIDPAKVITNAGAKPGDRLLLTKGLGTGVISTAIKKGVAKQAWIDSAVASMTTLNKRAAEIITNHVRTKASSAGSSVENPQQSSQDEGGRGHVVHAMTDITGFGLIGHARELALASDVSLRFFASHVPLLDGALDCVRTGYIPGGLKANREFAECLVGYDAGIPEELKTILFDPQTAGGLLVSVSQEDSIELLRALNAAGVPTVEIGEVLAEAKPTINVSLA